MTYELARRRIQRGAQILPGRLHLWVQCSSARPGAFHLGQLLVLGWRFLLEGQIQVLIAGERERLGPLAERQPWVRAQEMALRRLWFSIISGWKSGDAHHLAGQKGFLIRWTFWSPILIRQGSGSMSARLTVCVRMTVWEMLR